MPLRAGKGREQAPQRRAGGKAACPQHDSSPRQDFPPPELQGSNCVLFEGTTFGVMCSNRKRKLPQEERGALSVCSTGGTHNCEHRLGGPEAPSCPAPGHPVRGEGSSSVSLGRLWLPRTGRFAVGLAQKPAWTLCGPLSLFPEGPEPELFCSLRRLILASQRVPFAGCLMTPCAHNRRDFRCRCCKVELLHLGRIQPWKNSQNTNYHQPLRTVVCKRTHEDCACI